MDAISVLANGMISETGSYEQLLKSNGTFAQFLKTTLQTEEFSDADEDEEGICRI